MAPAPRRSSAAGSCERRRRSRPGPSRVPRDARSAQRSRAAGFHRPGSLGRPGARSPRAGLRGQAPCAWMPPPAGPRRGSRHARSPRRAQPARRRARASRRRGPLGAQPGRRGPGLRDTRGALAAQPAGPRARASRPARSPRTDQPARPRARRFATRAVALGGRSRRVGGLGLRDRAVSLATAQPAGLPRLGLRDRRGRPRTAHAGPSAGPAFATGAVPSDGAAGASARFDVAGARACPRRRAGGSASFGSAARAAARGLRARAGRRARPSRRARWSGVAPDGAAEAARGPRAARAWAGVPLRLAPRAPPRARRRAATGWASSPRRSPGRRIGALGRAGLRPRRAPNRRCIGRARLRLRLRPPDARGDRSASARRARPSSPRASAGRAPSGFRVRRVAIEGATRSRRVCGRRPIGRGTGCGSTAPRRRRRPRLRRGRRRVARRCLRGARAGSRPPRLRDVARAAAPGALHLGGRRRGRSAPRWRGRRLVTEPVRRSRHDGRLRALQRDRIRGPLRGRPGGRLRLALRRPLVADGRARGLGGHRRRGFLAGPR